MAAFNGYFLLVIIFAISVFILFPQFSVDQSLAKREIDIIDYDENVEKYLNKYQNSLGDDLEAYRNHIYRVLSYAMFYLNDNDQYQPIISVALVYHDLGLWTDSKLNYLEVSCKRAKKAMKDNGFNSRDINLAQDIIYYHHKITPFTGTSSGTGSTGTDAADNEIVNAVRKADWIDASYGIVNFG